jgi:predicted extracellular nuclease
MPASSAPIHHCPYHHTAQGGQLHGHILPTTDDRRPTPVCAVVGRRQAVIDFLKRLTLCLLVCALASSAGPLVAAGQPLRISQIYGGGGNSGATLQSDFVELFNASASPMDLSGWSVQYAAATSASWQVTPLNGVTIPAYGYLLVRQASGAGGSDAGTALTSPDVVGGSNLSASGGKVALVSSQSPLSGQGDPAVVDFVGYGSANEAEGTVVAALSNTNAALRNNAGCDDSDNNASDFSRVAAAPRNSAAPTNPCSLPPTATFTETPTDTPIPTATDAPVPVDTPTFTPSPTDTLLPVETATETPTETSLPIDTATLTPTDTLLPLDTVAPTPSETAVPVDTATSTPSETAAPAATDTPTPGGPPRLLISEFLADPKAVSDANGEWLELYNAGADPVNLRNWAVADLGSDHHTITSDLFIPPGGYLVLARNGDGASNGGAPVNYVYSGITLGNGDDALLLVAPDGGEIDRVLWGTAAGLPIGAGISYERANLDSLAAWVSAETPWPGSAGDKGSPGAAYAPPSTATPTATPTTADTPTDTPTAGPLPAILISEFLADPQAVGDTAGEWLELYNGSSDTVNLRNWVLADLGGEVHTIASDLLIAPGGHVVLARNGDSATNGGAPINYVYSGLNLANTDDALVLVAPIGAEVDRVIWGLAVGLPIRAGASYERANWDAPAVWALALFPWPGSAGDSGSPGATYVGPPTATPTPTPTLGGTATPTATPFAGPLPRILISEVLADPKSVGDNQGEWVELYNASPDSVNLHNWVLADLGGEAHTIAGDLVVPSGGYVVLARNGDNATNGGLRVDYVYSGVSLANGEDELLLLAPNGVEVDRLRWGAAVGLPTTPGASLERAGFADPPVWVTVQTVWPGSAGDYGSPGASYVAPPTATPTFAPTVGDTPTPTATHFSGPATRILISEFLADPQAVSDTQGEWIELYNASAAPVNLYGWKLTDLGGNLHTIAADLVVQPGGYVVLARNGDLTLNGGVSVHYLYRGYSLANGEDAIVLLAPNDEEVDRVAWGGDTALTVQASASYERTNLDDPAIWAIAQMPWPGSSGDLGSPGAAYFPPVATATPTITPLPGLAPRILISEFLADPKAVDDADGEWVELYNASGEPVNLRGWVLADLGSERHTIDADVVIPPGGYVVLARNGDVASNGGVAAHYVYQSFSLSNSEDEILLLAPGGAEADRVVWGSATPLAVQAGASYERTTLADPATWALAQTTWTGSSGDAGSPGAAYAPPQPTITSTPSPTSAAGRPPRILISEFLADPQAVSDADGEWVELYNATGEPMNLRGWVLADLGSERHTIDADLIIPPGGYLVLARNGDPAVNGGVSAAYVHHRFTLSNGEDEILLLAPNGQEADRVVWGGEVALEVSAGASLERATLDDPATWATAQSTWPGSAGDAGTPGTAYSPAPSTATPTPTLPLPGAWPPVSQASPLVIDEVIYQGSKEEGIVLINLGSAPLDLSGWAVGDAQTPGNGESMVALPSGHLLEPGALFVLARNGAAFRSHWGRSADGEVEASDPDTPDLVRRRDLATGNLALNDGGDEVVLLNPSGQLADAVAFEKGDYAGLGLAGLLEAPNDYSLQRVPDARFPAVAEVRHRFLFAPPRPFEPRGLPLAQVYDAALLDDGFYAVWGSLGARSNFSPGFTAPPHYLLSAAAAQGLDFVAIADPNPSLPWGATHSALHLPAWRWQQDKALAVVYTQQDEAVADGQGLLDWLAATGSLAQWQSNDPPVVASVPAIAADDAGAPGDLTSLSKSWLAAGAPLLPAGNANPPLPGAIEPLPRYTGLVVNHPDTAGVLAALAARRGWLTNAPGLWLTLQIEQAAGSRVWMGSTLPPSNEVTIHLYYGDRTGQVAGLAIWRDNRPLHQLDIPSPDGRWSVKLPAAPGSFFFAVATQADGDFAVTAPVSVAPASDGRVVINEVLPAPAADHNVDGVVNGDDEFIELYNSGSQPISLAGWQLSDNTGDADPTQRFTFDQGRLLNGGEWLLIWRKESYINQNVENDSIRLINSMGEEVDRIDWGASPDNGESISRIPDGEGWVAGTLVTPGRANARPAVNPPDNPTDGDHHDEDEEARPSSTEGQAGGPPGSLAQAKLAGLQAWVEFGAVVVVPPGLFNNSIYVADPAPDIRVGPYAGIGINVFLRKGEFPPLQEGDRVLVRGLLRSFRGEMELQLEDATQIWRSSGGAPLLPLAVTPGEVGESLEGRLVNLRGVVSGWQGDSIFLVDPAQPEAEPVRVVVRSSLGWKRPYVQRGERWQVTGVVSQMARAAPWNDGYRVLVRYQLDLARMKR